MTPKKRPTQVIPEEKPSQRWLDALVRFWVRSNRLFWDMSGVAALTLAVVLLLGISGLSSGVWLTPITGFIRRWLGWGSIFLIIFLGIFGLWMLWQHKSNPIQLQWGRVLWLELAAFALLAFFSWAGSHSLIRAESGLDGGLIGWGLVELLSLILPSWGSGILLVLITGIGLLVGLGQMEKLSVWIKQQLLGETASPRHITDSPAVSVSPMDSTKSSVKNTVKPKPKLPAEFKKQFKVTKKESPDQPPPQRENHLPPLSILINQHASRPDERNINLTAGLIEKTLSDFGVSAKVVGFRIGPTVTQFALEPGYLEKPGSNEIDEQRQKVRVAQISALQRDLALALSATRLRIEAPVPGRSFVGIEVPNARSEKVRLRPILENPLFYQIKSPLAIALGRDVSGTPLVADLASMPHLLVAGTTGSGKSVSIEALTTCLVMNNSPENLRLVMIDPKKVELVRFNGLPHLLGKVETDLERILGVLRWTVAEMERRYQLLETMRSRHIGSYNRKIRRRKNGELLPYIVVIIDEMADLMMSAPDQTEHALVRLAQMARATGIHLVMATQRPSADVVTGLIKANFPARISFAMASSIDSRVILDTPGAEHLLGRGDMLFLPPDAPAPIRAQGVVVSDREIERVIEFWQQSVGGEVQAPPWEDMLAQEAVLSDRDDLVVKAIELVRNSQHASASMLQRRLRIGYPRAARLMDALEELGVVGPSQGGGRERDVLIGPDDEVDFSNSNDED